jgi:cold shock CspA family protein/ribosome-associated translation inhibitor RaiA
MTQTPVQVTFRGIDHSDAVEYDVRERLAWLEQFHRNIMRCQVVLEIPHRHRHNGRHVHVRLELTVPGHEPIVVSHEPSLHAGARDAEEEVHRKTSEVESVRRYAHVAVREAFDVARRLLEDVARVDRRVVKSHETPAHGEVAQLEAADGYGFIRAGERLIYFNRASVLEDHFDDLAVGARVAFAEEQGEKGPQASTVRVLGKHHYAGPNP